MTLRVEPRGLGTSSVESLSSFVRRLAAVQVRSVSELLRSDVLVPLRTERRDRQLLLAPTRAAESVNGAGTGTEELVERVARLADVRADSLRRTTVVALSPAIECRAAFRTTRAWCPPCLEADGEAAYDRLLWSFAIVDRCDKHRVALVDVCARCRQAHRPWHARANPFGCPYCGLALSAARGDQPASSGMASATTAATAALIAWVESGKNPSPSAVAGGFWALAQASGGLDRLAQRIGGSKSGLSTVASGLTRPHLSTFINALLLSEQDLVAFLSHPAPERVARHHRVIQRDGRRAAPTIPRSVSVRPLLRTLRDEMQRAEPRSLRALARAHGTTPATLRRAAPQLCAVLVARRQTASSAGRKASEAAVTARVRTALLALRGAGSEPTRREIEAFLGQPGLFRAPAARAALLSSGSAFVAPSQ